MFMCLSFSLFMLTKFVSVIHTRGYHTFRGNKAYAKYKKSNNVPVNQ